MKLLKCYVFSFGKIKNYTVEFNQGLNSIKEDNGWGKTTLAYFIKSMFYGLSGGARNLSNNERKRFTPWNSTEKFGGYIDFELGGANYRIERFFGKKPSDDTIKFIDLFTGKEVYDVGDDLGKKIFQIDEEGFLSTTFFSQKDFEVKSNASLTAKYNAVYEYNADVDFEKAIVELENNAKRYKYLKGDKGIIADVKNELYAIEEKIAKINEDAITLDGLKNKLKILEKEKEQLYNQVNFLTDDISESAKNQSLFLRKKEYSELVLEKQNLEKQINDYHVCFGGTVPNENQLVACDELYKNFVELNAKENSLKNDATEMIDNSKQKNDKNIWLFFMLFSLVLIVVGLSISVFYYLMVGVVCSLIGLSLFIFSLTLFLSRKDKRTDLCGVASGKQSELHKITSLKLDVEQRLKGFLQRFNFIENIDYFGAIQMLRKTVLEYYTVLDKLENLNNKIALLSKQLSSINSLSNVKSIESLRLELVEKNSLLQQKINELSTLKSTITSIENRNSILFELENRHAELKNSIVEFQEKYELLVLTASYLKKADENLKAKYREPLEQSLNKYLSYLTDTSISAKIDIDMAVTIDEYCGGVSADFFSEGYRNIFEICKHLALTDVLFKDEKPFIILDDPFANLDDKKVGEGLNLLKNLSNEYQIIYFVCHESRGF